MLPVKKLKPGDKIMIREAWAPKDCATRPGNSDQTIPAPCSRREREGNQMLHHKCGDLWDGEEERSTGGSRDA